MINRTCQYGQFSGTPCDSPGPYYAIAVMNGGVPNQIHACRKHFPAVKELLSSDVPVTRQDPAALLAAHFGDRYRDASFDTFITEGERLEDIRPFMHGLTSKAEATMRASLQAAREFAESVKRTGQGMLVLCGREGVGKTMLAAATSRHLMESGKRVAIRQTARFVTDIRSTYVRSGVERSKQTTNDYMDPLLKADVVVLDDLRPNCFQSDIMLLIHDIINDIYANRKGLILTSNLTIKDLRKPENLGPHIVSRLEESPSWILDLDTPNWRTAIKRRDLNMPVTKK